MARRWSRHGQHVYRPRHPLVGFGPHTGLGKSLISPSVGITCGRTGERSQRGRGSQQLSAVAGGYVNSRAGCILRNCIGGKQGMWAPRVGSLETRAHIKAEVARRHQTQAYMGLTWVCGKWRAKLRHAHGARDIGMFFCTHLRSECPMGDRSECLVHCCTSSSGFTDKNKHGL